MSSNTYKDTGTIADIVDDKRCYLPLKLKTKCPSCGDELIKDFSDDYLSYPDFNKPIKVGLWCESCNNEFTIDVNFTITATLECDLSTIKKYE